MRKKVIRSEKIAAYAPPLLVNLEGCFGRAGKFIAELNVVVYPVADGLDAAPARRRVAEQIPRRYC